MDQPNNHNEPINDALRRHASDIEDWRFAQTITWLHLWSNRFISEFGLEIETPAIRIDRIRKRALGTYRYGRNGFGLRHEITFNVHHIARPPAEILETLLHELLHQWQDMHGKPGKGNYHNREFIRKAFYFGLKIDQRGRSLGVVPGSLFMQLLERYDIDTTVLPLPQEFPIPQRKQGRSKLHKWSCGCTNVRVATRLNAQCLSCGRRFHQAEPSWTW